MDNFNIKKINGKAVIARTGYIYRNYQKWADASGYPQATSPKTHVLSLKDKTVELVAKGNHGEVDGRLIYLVKDERENYYMLEEYGLSDIEEVDMEGNLEVWVNREFVGEYSKNKIMNFALDETVIGFSYDQKSQMFSIELDLAKVFESKIK